MHPTDFTLHGVRVDTAAPASHKDGHRVSILHNTPLLENTASTGRKKYWQGFVVAECLDGQEVTVYTRTVSFQETKDGVSTLNVSTPKRIEGKNIGRSNETSPRAQAISEIDAHAERQRDKKYRGLGEAPVAERPLPMLAHSYDKRSHNVDWPAFVQPKLDGVRMLFDGTEGWSRMGKTYIPEVVAHLAVDLSDALPKGAPEGTHLVLDGELMLDHNQYSFQETIRIVKKYRGDDAPKLEYHVYDCLVVNEDGTQSSFSFPFQDRIRHLASLFQGQDDDGRYVWAHNADNLSLKAVPTFLCTDEAQMQAKHGEFVGQGYEGTMVRNLTGDYKAKHRTVDLQKYKDFVDEEFEIVGFTEGKGKDEGTVVFQCVTPGDEALPFMVRPRGTYAERAALYETGDKQVGKMLTVRYQNLTEDGIPRFPVGLAVRDYE
jgi:DNA ligase 1